MVLMDNATAEYVFITSFFANEPRPSPQGRDGLDSAATSPPILSPTYGEFDDMRSEVGSENVSLRARPVSIHGVIQAAANHEQTAKEEQATLNILWKQVMDPVLDYCQVSPAILSVLLIAQSQPDHS